MSGLGFLAGLGLLGGAAASKMAAPQSLSKHYRTDVVESNSRVASWFDNLVYKKIAYFYNFTEGCSRLAWKQYCVNNIECKDFIPRTFIHMIDEYTFSFYGYDLERVYYDIVKIRKKLGFKERSIDILRDITRKFLCDRSDLTYKTCMSDVELFDRLYDRYTNNKQFMKPEFRKIQRAGEEIIRNNYDWSNKQKEIYIIKSFPECFTGRFHHRNPLTWSEDINYETLKKWIPMESAENLNRLKAEIELVYGSTLQDTIHKIWMNGGEGTYLAPGNDPNRARRDGNSIFIHCSVHDYGKSSAHVTGFDFPPVNDYEREIYQRYAELKKEE